MDAMKLYGSRRTHDSKGLSIPSQRRSVMMFKHFLEKNIGKPYLENALFRLQDGIDNIIPVYEHCEIVSLFLGPFSSV